VSIEVSGFMLVSNTLTEPVWDTVNRDLARMVSNLKLVAFILKKKKKKLVALDCLEWGLGILLMS
jgi:hypothetical protein